MTFRFACLLSSFALLCPALASAESRPSMFADYVGPARAGAIELDLGWYTQSETASTVHVLLPALSGRIAVTDSFDLELDWPLAFATVSSDFGEGTDEFRSGNPFFAGYYVSRLSDGYLRAGFGVAPPLATANDLGDLVPLTLAAAMHGLWDSWLYLPERLSLVVPFQLESRKRVLLFGLDSALAVLIPTGDYGDETDVALQLAGIIGARTDVVSAGARLQLAWIPTGGDADNAQVALVPFVQADFPTGVFLHLRILINLDEPFGVFGDGLDVWSISAGGGARF